MWRSLWGSIDRFSLHHFKYIINELQQIKVVGLHNRELVSDLLHSIVEIVTYGDKQDPLIFECFMEFQVLAVFVRILKIGRNSQIEGPVLQYLSIMIQNMDSEHAIYYCFSNGYINEIIAHPYEFTGGDVASYYVSFLRAVSSKVNRDTLCLLVQVHKDAVVSFPLYSEALKFAQDEEKMIQTAVRALTLNIYNVGDDMLFKFVTTPPVSHYFSGLVLSFMEQCVHLDNLVRSVDAKREELLLETEKIVDELYYFKDVLSLGVPLLNKTVTENLLRLLVFPILLPLLQLGHNSESTLSAITSLYAVSRLLQVVGGKYMIDSVAALIMYPYMTLKATGTTNNRTVDDLSCENSLCNRTAHMEILEYSGCETEAAESTNMKVIVEHNTLLRDQNANYNKDDNKFIERSGILGLVFSEDKSLSLASIFLMLVLQESKGNTSSCLRCVPTCDVSDTCRLDEGILVRFMPQIVSALLETLANKPPYPALILWHTGWLLQKILVMQRASDSHNADLFSTSYEQSFERLREELESCWFDHILDTVKREWTNCKTALEEQSQSKDPLFALEIAVSQQLTNGYSSSYIAWLRMVDTVKAFVLHLQLKAFILKGDLVEKPFLNLTTSMADDSGRPNASDFSHASFGSEVSLASGVPCQIAFSTGIRDIYLIPLANEASGKLLLAEKHPFRSRRGIVIAIAPLAGLSPDIDEEHPTWLHLLIRELNPTLYAREDRGRASKAEPIPSEGRWTLGFPSERSCKAARLLILGETIKQRSFVENMLNTLLQSTSLKNLPDSQGE